MLTVLAPTRLFKKAGFTSPWLKATLFSHLAGLGRLAGSRGDSACPRSSRQPAPALFAEQVN